MLNHHFLSSGITKSNFHIALRKLNAPHIKYYRRMIKPGVNNFKVALMFALMFCHIIIARAQNFEIFKPDSIKKALEAVEISGDLHIDGILDEED